MSVGSQTRARTAECTNVACIVELRFRFPLGDSATIKPLRDKTHQIARYFEEAVLLYSCGIPLFHAAIPVKRNHLG